MIKEITLTDQQRKIINHDGAQIVVAGAGTGKTETLTRHILYLLLEKQYALHEVVAITFTEKAAGEMRERVYDAISAKVLSTQNEEEKNRLAKLQINFPAQNRITTIDGFNASLLASYPEFSPLSVDYQIVDDYTKYILDTEIKRALFRGLEDEENLSEVLQQFSSLYEQMGQKRLFTRVKELALESSEDLVEITKDISREEFEADLRNLLKLRNQEVEEEYLALLPDDIPSEMQESMHDLESVIKPRGMFGVDGSFAKKWKDKYPEFAESFQDEAAPKIKELKELDKLLNPKDATANGFDLDWQCHQALRKLAALAQLYKKHQHDIIRQQGKVRFEDVASAVLEMLKENSRLRDEIRGGIKHILVDEFQDTSEAQWSLVQLLRGDDNVMLVGDPKQSIYRFRGADVTVFDRVRKAEFAESQQRELTRSQRAQPSLVRFYNALFSSVLSTGESRAEYEAEHQDLDSEKPEEPESGVTWIDSSVIENESEIVKTPEALACFLKALQEDARRIANGEKVLLFPQYQKTSERLSKEETGVIGVLCISHKQKSTFEKALRDEGVQFSSYHGRGFYDSMPVLLAINLARFFYNQTDSLALAGILRSPLCGLSDEMLMRLSLHDKALWNALGEAATNSGLFSKNHAHLQEIYTMIDAWRDASRVLPFSDVLENIWRDSWLSFSHALENNGDQQQENFSKLIDILRRAQQNSEYGLVEIVEFLQTLREEEASESQAELPEGGSVQLMTIHAAKGLGFDMTILPQLNKVSKASSATVRSAFLGDLSRKYFAIKSVDGADKKGGALWTILEDEDRARDLAEIKRQLYVACTRSKEHLVLIMPKTPRKNTWEKWLDIHSTTHEYRKFTLEALLEISKDIVRKDLQSDGDSMKVGIVEAPLDGAKLPQEISVSQLLDVLFPQAEKDIETAEENETQRLPVGAKKRGSLIHRLLEWDGKSTFAAIENLMRLNHLPENNTKAMQELAQDVREKLLELPLDHKAAKQEFAFILPAATLHDLLISMDVGKELEDWLAGNDNWCNGIIDYLAPLQDDGCAVLDFKTHWNPAVQYSEVTQKRIKMQLQLYAVAARHLNFDVKKLYALRIYGDSGKTQLEEFDL